MLGLKSLFWLPAGAIAFSSESFRTFEVLRRQQFKKNEVWELKTPWISSLNRRAYEDVKKSGRIYQPYIKKKNSDVWCFLQTEPFVLD